MRRDRSLNELYVSCLHAWQTNLYAGKGDVQKTPPRKIFSQMRSYAKFFFFFFLGFLMSDSWLTFVKDILSYLSYIKMTYGLTSKKKLKA